MELSIERKFKEHVTINPGDCWSDKAGTKFVLIISEDNHMAVYPAIGTINFFGNHCLQADDFEVTCELVSIENAVEEVKKYILQKVKMATTHIQMCRENILYHSQDD